MSASTHDGSTDAPLAGNGTPRSPVFVTTQWSVVLSAGGEDTTRARDSLAKLCQTYWYPLYAYVPRRGYGGHPFATNELASVGGEWRYVQDEYGVGILLPASQFPAVDAYLRSAFGPPSSQAGWSVRDIGVAIYLQQVGSNAEVSVLHPMSDEQMARAAQKMDELVKKNTK